MPNVQCSLFVDPEFDYLTPVERLGMLVNNVFVVVCFFLLYPPLGLGQLVDRSLQEKMRRNAIQVDVPLFTIEHLSQLPNARVSVGTGKSRVTKSLAAQPNADESPEKVDRTRAPGLLEEQLDSAREKLSSAVNLLHVLRLRHNHLRNLYLNASDEPQRMRLEADLRELLEELKLAEKEEERARQAWRLVHSEAAKAGLSPGEEPAEAASIGD